MSSAEKLMAALVLLNVKYGDINISVGHDVIYFGTVKKVSPSDHDFIIKQLECGEERETDSYYVFV